MNRYPSHHEGRPAQLLRALLPCMRDGGNAIGKAAFV